MNIQYVPVWERILFFFWKERERERERSSLVAQWVKDLALSQLWLGSLLWCGIVPWPGNFHMPQVWSQTNKQTNTSLSLEFSLWHNGIISISAAPRSRFDSRGQSRGHTGSNELDLLHLQRTLRLQLNLIPGQGIPHASGQPKKKRKRKKKRARARARERNREQENTNYQLIQVTNHQDKHWGPTVQHRELDPISWERIWWKIIWEKECMYMYDWVTPLYRRNWYNTVNQWCFRKFLIKKPKTDQRKSPTTKKEGHCNLFFCLINSPTLDAKEGWCEKYKALMIFRGGVYWVDSCTHVLRSFQKELGLANCGWKS